MDPHAPSPHGVPAASVSLIRHRGSTGEHLSVAERVARGRAARRAVPRGSQGIYLAAADRRDPIEILSDQAESRVAELVPIRYGRMMESPFAFLRGSAAVMAADLAGLGLSGLRVQACGDAHLMNFGIFSSPEREQVFDINDFDETLPGPWEWDLKRLVASVEVAARSNGFTSVECAASVAAAARQYRKAMAGFAEQRTLEVWYASLPVERVLAAASRLGTPASRATRKKLSKALTRDSLQAFSKLTISGPDGARFASAPPLLVPVEELDDSGQVGDLPAFLNASLRDYRRTLTQDRRHLLDSFQVVDMARKVVGVGSVGTRAWVVLALGRDGDDPLIMQVKEAQHSVLEPYLGRSGFSNCGQRVVVGQRLMQASSDILLGWHHTSDGLDGRPRDFYVRQLRDGKGSADVATMVPAGLAAYASLCGWTLARAHARSGDSVAISSYLGTGSVFDEAMVAFARSYGDQAERDHAALVAAVKAGRVPAETGI